MYVQSSASAGKAASQLNTARDVNQSKVNTQIYYCYILEIFYALTLICECQLCCPSRKNVCVIIW